MINHSYSWLHHMSHDSTWLRHMWRKYESVKYNKCVRPPDSLGGLGLWFSVFTILSPPSFHGPQLWRSTSMCSSLYLLTRAHCAQCSPSIPLWLALYLLAPAGGRTPSHHCALRIPVLHDRRRACLNFVLVYHAFWAWCRSCFQVFETPYSQKECFATFDSDITWKCILSNTKTILWSGTKKNAFVQHTISSTNKSRSVWFQDNMHERLRVSLTYTGRCNHDPASIRASTHFTWSVDLSPTIVATAVLKLVSKNKWKRVG